MSCTTRTATLESAVQTELAICGTSSRNVTADVTSLRTIRTSKKEWKQMQQNKSNTEGMARSQQCTQNPLCLSLSDEPSHESHGKHLQTNRTVHSLLCQQQHSFQLGSPSSDSMRGALSVRSRRCHQVAQQLGALAAKSSVRVKDQRMASPYRCVFSHSPAPAATPFSTHFRCNVLHAGIVC